jgi:hypothetical protein
MTMLPPADSASRWKPPQGPKLTLRLMMTVPAVRTSMQCPFARNSTVDHAGRDDELAYQEMPPVEAPK